MKDVEGKLIALRKCFAVFCHIKSSFNKGQNSAEQLADPTVWEIFLPDVEQYFAYKYSVETAHRSVVMKADPFGAHMPIL